MSGYTRGMNIRDSGSPAVPLPQSPMVVSHIGGLLTCNLSPSCLAVHGSSDPFFKLTTTAPKLPACVRGSCELDFGEAVSTVDRGP